MRYMILFLLSLLLLPLWGQNGYETKVAFEKNEYWWGGAVGLGSKMPYMVPLAEFDLSSQNLNNQVCPFLLSNKGRYIWSDAPFRFEILNDEILIKSDFEEIVVQKSGETLRDAYLSACQKYFPPSGVLPDHMFFDRPQYNTWIELMYNQNQEDILRYAKGVVDNGFPSGVLMIDDNWQKYYGNFEFKPDKFPDPKGMVERLHAMDFKVMVWICPFVSPDSPEYRHLSGKGYLIKEKNSKKPAIINWWNGQSACFDLTNPEAKDYFVSLLRKMQEEYGIDGFKLDAGDNNFYNAAYIDSYKLDAKSVDHTKAWAEIGLEFPFNEYRAGWQMGGQALVQRLGDKDYSWRAVGILIPEMTAAGLLGYAYTCPDMIGGGQYSAFLGVGSDEFDQELIVRSAQIHAMMPMMQFSVAPWRILSEENLKIVRDIALLHQNMGDYILACAKESAITGEPIVRHMEYSFPEEGFAGCTDQYMLGDKYLVAPVITSNNTRTVKLPKGKWRDDTGKVYKGGKTYVLEIPLHRLLFFEKI